MKKYITWHWVGFAVEGLIFNAVLKDLRIDPTWLSFAVLGIDVLLFTITYGLYMMRLNDYEY